jgi:hypothetical protein
MPTDILSKIKPKNNGQFPAYDDIDAYGGYQVRTTTTDRNSIPTLNRKAGMLVYVQADGYFYQLGGGLTNSDWTVSSFGSGSASLIGDVTGFTTSTTVVKLQGNALQSGTLGSSQDGYVLTWVNGSSQYQPKPTNASNFVINRVTTSYPVVASDQIISIGTTSGPISITLPASPILGKWFIIKDAAGLASSNNITIVGNGHNIDGAATLILNLNYQALNVVYDGVGWIIT